MRKLKSLIAAFLIISTVFFIGCSNIQVPILKNGSDLHEITAVSKAATRYRSIDILDDTVLLLSLKGIAPYDLTLYNIRENKITAQKILADFPLENITEAKFNGSDQIIVCDENNKKAITYDFDLDQTGEIDYTVSEWDHNNVPESELIADYFSFTDDYAYHTDNDNFYFVLYDKPDKVYFFKNYAQNILAEHNGLLFVENSIYSEDSDSFTLTVSAIDYENELCVNEISFDVTGKNRFIDIQNFVISDKYICFTELIINDETNAVKEIPYLWKYTENPLNKTVEVKKMTVDDLNEDNNHIIKEIKEKYGIDIKVNEPAEHTSFESDYDAPAISVNSLLRGLSEVFALFPDNFIKEIYRDQKNDSRFSIYVVSNIDGAGGYAFDSSDYYQIVFATMTFDKSVAVHELMHLIDNRIIDYYKAHNSDFDKLWCNLNPDGFDYLDNNYYDEEYFITEYASTNIDEDMAEMFRFMYYAYKNGDNWFNEYEHINKKAVLLCEAIRKAFPSMENTEDVFWEKYVEFAEQ